MAILRPDDVTRPDATSHYAESSGSLSPSNIPDLRPPPTITKGMPVSATVDETQNAPGPSSPKAKNLMPPSFFPTPALDQACAGITAGAVATVCMNPLDLIKTQFQVDTSVRRRPPLPGLGKRGPTVANVASPPPRWREIVTGGRVARDMWAALKTIVVNDGWSGLYRGLSANVVGNSASWGLYFLWYTMIKEHMAESMPVSDDGRSKKLSPGQHLLAASESGAVTALMTNPIWVVKTRMFTTSTKAPTIAKSSGEGTSAVSQSTHQKNPYRTLRSSLAHIYQYEGMRGLWKGAGLALFGVSNGAIQFMAYEQLKRYRSDVALRKMGGIQNVDASQLGSEGQVKLANTEYVVISGVAKLVAIGLTYPYQVIRSRIQNHATSHLYPNVRTCVALTYRHEGVRAFYKGMTANLVRILPATCVTFVVYENVSWALNRAAKARVGAGATEQDTKSA